MKHNIFKALLLLVFTVSTSLAYAVPTKPLSQRWIDKEALSYISENEFSYGIMQALAYSLPSILDTLELYANLKGQSFSEYFCPEEMNSSDRHELFETQLRELAQTSEWGQLIGSYYMYVWDSNQTIQNQKFQEFAHLIHQCASDCESRTVSLYTYKEIKELMKYEKYPNCIQDTLSFKIQQKYGQPEK